MVRITEIRLGFRSGKLIADVVVDGLTYAAGMYVSELEVTQPIKLKKFSVWK